MSGETRARAWHLIAEAARLGELGREDLAANLLSVAAAWMQPGRESGGELARFASSVAHECCSQCGFHGSAAGGSHFAGCPTLYDTPEARVLR